MMIKKHLPLFELLVEASECQRKAILKTLTDQQLHAVVEAIYNVLQGVCPLNSKDKKKLIDYKSVIRRLVSKELTKKQQQRLLHKNQDILPLLMKPVVNALKRASRDGSLRIRTK